MVNIDPETLVMYQQRIKALQAETELLYDQLRREQDRNRELRRRIDEFDVANSLRWRTGGNSD